MTKYRAKPVVIDNIRFHSKREGKRYGELKLLLRGNVIQQLTVQPEFICTVKDKKICTYRADFSYYENGSLIIEDVKGFKTPVYRLKKKLVEAIHGIEIREI